ncbi:MAG: polysaccharide biosynthesis C-terminal domain-containing protein [Collinsella aerofaciens]
MLTALNVPAETMPLASLYLRVFLLSMPSILLYNFEAAIFRSVGITRMPLQALAVSTVLNIGLDLIFVPVLHWGVAGVAIATAIAYTVSAATLFIRLLKTDSVVRVTPRDLAIDPVALKRIVKIGLPPASKRRLCRRQHHHQSAINAWAQRSWRHRRRHEPRVRVLQPAQQL